MKKHFFIAAAIAVAAFSSCSNDNDFANSGINGENQDKTPILLSMTDANISVTTRGTGTVGDTLNGDNVWRGEKLNVYMFKKGTLDLAQDVVGDIFNNAEITAPSAIDAANVGYASYGNPKFYPMTGNYDFFAYHADDAMAVDEFGEKAVPELNENGDQYILPLVLNGTQDIMVSKADLSNEQRDAFVAMVGDEHAERYYSAFSARKKIGFDGLENEDGIQPHFIFQHLLSRLAFFVKPSSRSVSNLNVSAEGEYLGVNIDSVKIMNTFTKADLVVASIDSTDYLLNESEVASVALMQRNEEIADDAENLVTLDPVMPEWDDVEDAAITTRVGESLLLVPQESFELEIYMSQTPAVGSAKIVLPFPVTITPQELGGFKAGRQYNITFTVYGAEEIKINVELVPWEFGEDISIDNDLMN